MCVRWEFGKTDYWEQWKTEDYEDENMEDTGHWEEWRIENGQYGEYRTWLWIRGKRGIDGVLGIGRKQRVLGMLGRIYRIMWKCPCWEYGTKPVCICGLCKNKYRDTRILGMQGKYQDHPSAACRINTINGDSGVCLKNSWSRCVMKTAAGAVNTSDAPLWSSPKGENIKHSAAAGHVVSRVVFTVASRVRARRTR